MLINLIYVSAYSSTWLCLFVHQTYFHMFSGGTILKLYGLHGWSINSVTSGCGINLWLPLYPLGLHLLFFWGAAMLIRNIVFYLTSLDSQHFFSICSIEFDRDDELFATAGVSRRIKVFEFNSVCLKFYILSIIKAD